MTKKSNKYFRVILPPVPSVNALYFTTKFGKRIRTKKGKEWFEVSERIIRDEIQKQHWVPKDGTKYIIEVNTHWKDRRRRDCDNQSKAICDSLTHAGVYDDDCHVLIRYIDYDVDKENAGVDIVVREFTNADSWKY